MSNLEALIQAAQYLEENDRELLRVYVHAYSTCTYRCICLDLMV